MASVTDEADRRLGELGVRERLVTPGQVEECLKIRARLSAAAGAKDRGGVGGGGKGLGDILVEKGYLTRKGLARLETMLAADLGAGPVPSPSEPVPPQKLQIPGYEILALLGKGGMGAVYKARQLSLDRIVALKVLSPESSRDETYLKRFMTEARALARLNHENIVAGIDVGEANGFRYFAMEYIDGEPLSGVIEREGALPEKRALKIGMQVARALAHAEKHGLVHRDVKPQNIMIARNDTAKLCDLGLAMTPEEQGRGLSASGAGGSARGTSLGTPHYVSPEQARGEHKVDIRSDIYSLGATLYHVVTGETPFAGTSPMVLMTKHLTEDPVPPRRRNNRVSKGVNDLILRMMAKDPDERYGSPVELLEEMERVLQGRGGGGSGGGGAAGAGAIGPAGGMAAGPGLGRGGGALLRAPALGRDGGGRGDGRRERSLAAGPARSSTSLGLALLGLFVFALLIAGYASYALRKRPDPEKNVVELAGDQEEAAWSMVKKAARLAEEDPRAAVALYREVIARWPKSKPAYTAEDHVKEIEKTHGAIATPPPDLSRPIGSAAPPPRREEDEDGSGGPRE